MPKTIKISEKTYDDVIMLKDMLEKEETLTGVYHIGISTAVGYAIKKAILDMKNKKKFMKSAGGWSDIDGGKMIKDIYKSRLKGTNWNPGFD